MIGMGNNKAICTLKVMKVTTVWKNHDEGGSCGEFVGSNSHLSGDRFSLSSVFFKISVVNVVMAVDRKSVNVTVAVVIVIINYTVQHTKCYGNETRYTLLI